MDNDCAILQLYLGVRFAEQPYFRLPLKGVQASKTVAIVKSEVEDILKHPNKELEFIYRGRILTDERTLAQQQVRHGSTIQVFRRTAPPAARCLDVQEADIQAAVVALRKVTVQVTLVKSFSPAVIRDVLEEYPEFYTELGALAILRNLLLWSKIGKTEFAKRIAETYPLLIISAPFVVTSFRKHGGALGVDELSDGSVTSDDEMSPPVPMAPLDAPTNEERFAARIISRFQLADALIMATGGMDGGDSGANGGDGGAGSSGAVAGAGAAGGSGASAFDAYLAPPAASGPSTSSSSSSLSASSTSATAATATTGDRSNRITNLAFVNALRDAYRDSGVTMPVAAAAPVVPAAAVATAPSMVAAPPEAEVNAFIAQSRQQYTAELQIMREMGLTDEGRNVQALIVCTGDVERAINLVLGGMA